MQSLFFITSVFFLTILPNDVFSLRNLFQNVVKGITEKQKICYPTGDTERANQAVSSAPSNKEKGEAGRPQCQKKINDRKNNLGAGVSYLENDISGGTDSETTRWNIYWERKLQPTFLAKQFKFIKNSVIKADYKYNRYYFIYDSPEQDYKESLFTVSLRFKL